MATIGELVGHIRFTVSGVRDLNRADKGVRDIRMSLADIARAAGTAGAALGGITGIFGKTILGIQASQNRLAATFLEAANASDLRMLNQQAFELGSRTSRTISDATNAQVAFARAGFNVNDTFAATPHVLNLAIAGELEMGEAAKLAANQLRAFKLDAEEAGRVADVLARAASLTNTTVGELGPALRNVAPAASAFNLSLEEVVAGVGSLRNIGMIPEQAGTALRNFFLRLLTDNEEIKKDFQRIGTSNEEVINTLVTKGLAPTMALMSDKGNVTVAERLLAFRNIFGQRTIAGALELSSIVPRFKELQGALEGAGGSADLMREHIESRLPGAIIRLKSAFEGAIITMGDAGFTGALVKMAELLREVLLLFIAAPTWLKWFVGIGLISVTVGLLGLAAAITTVLFAWGSYKAAMDLLVARQQLMAWWTARQSAATKALTFDQIVNTEATKGQAAAVRLRTFNEIAGVRALKGSSTATKALTFNEIARTNAVRSQAAATRVRTFNELVGINATKSSTAAEAANRVVYKLSTAERLANAQAQIAGNTVRKAGTASTVAETGALGTNTVAQGTNTAYSRRMAADRRILNAIRGTGTAVTNADTVSTGTNTAAQRANILAMRGGISTRKGLTVAQVIGKFTTDTSTVSTSANTAATRTNTFARFANTIVLGAQTVATLAAAAATWLLNVALLAMPLLIPLLLLAGFIAFWGGMGYLVYRFRGQILGVFKEIGEVLKNIAGAIGEFFVSAAEWVVDLAQLVADKIKGWFDGIAGWAKTIMNFILPGTPFDPSGEGRSIMTLPPAAPVNAIVTSPNQNTTNSQTSTVVQQETNIEKIEVNDSTGNSREIANTIREEIRKEFGSAVQELAVDGA